MSNQSFPEQIFKGTHSERPDLSTVRAPDHLDYLILVKEMKATQEYLFALSQNSEFMPDIGRHVSKIAGELSILNTELEAITPPVDLAKHFENFKEVLETLEKQRDATELKVDAELISIRTTLENNQLSTLKLQETFANKVKGFQNKLLSTLKVFEKEVSKRLEDVESKIERANVQAKIGNLLSQLDKK